MFKEEPYATYKYQAQNIDMNKQSFKEKTINVLDYEFVKTYDSVNEISSGTFANRLISIDPVTRSYKVTDFDYLKYIYENQSFINIFINIYSIFILSIKPIRLNYQSESYLYL
jgi:hypothetical protein